MPMQVKVSRQILSLAALFIAAVAVIYYFLPQNDSDSYNYEVNHPWSYALLTAPFDIPIHLDSVSAASIKDSIDRNFEPIFYRDIASENAVIEQYDKRLATITVEGHHISTGQRNYLVTQLRKLYNQGIAGSDVLAETKTDNVRMLTSGNSAVSVATASFLTPRDAYVKLDSTIAGAGRELHEIITKARLSEIMVPNIIPDTVQTDRFRNEAYQVALAPIGVVQQGERIIDRGDIVTPQLYTILSTYEQLSADRGASVISDRFYPVAGHILYIVIILGTLYSYLYFFRRDYLESMRSMLLIMLLVCAVPAFTFVLSSHFISALYLIPFTIVPILLLVFLDSRTAFFTYLVTLLLTVLCARFLLEFMALEFVAGIAALASIRELSKRSQLLRTALVVFLAYSVTYVAVDLLQTGSIKTLMPRTFGFFAINAVCVSFAYIMVFVLEKIFGFTSKVTLVELSDINNPVLRELSEECPGTFQHSMAVSNLASAAANRIRANVQLVRAGALYHDIGKISNPAFFTENQHGVNPHDVLDPKQSARIVIGHVSEGQKRAVKAKLPKAITDFISQHHGKGTARYFYTSYCNAHPNETPDPAPFMYPGPNPQSREASILMMADAVEAASRSLSDHSPEAISALVNKIIDSQIAEGLHNESPISFRDVTDIKDTFISHLRTMYHSRISYPESIRPAAPKSEGPAS